MSIHLQDDRVYAEIERLLNQIAEMQRSQALLRTEFNLLATFLDTTDALVLMLDHEGRIKRFNRAFKGYFGDTGESWTGKPIWDLPYSNPDGTLADKAENYSLQGFLNQRPNVTHLLKREGIPCVIAWSHQVYMDEEGTIGYVITTGIDVTERVQFEALLEREQALLRSLIDSIPDLIFYKDLEGFYLGCNSAFETFSGRSRQEITNQRTDFDFYPPEMAQAFRETDLQVMTSRETLSYENRVTRADGRQVILETSKSPYYGPGGELLGIIGVIRDITKQKEDAEALRKANSEIAQLIASLSSILIVLSLEGSVVQWNPAAQRHLGVSASQALGKQLGELEVTWEWNAIQESLDHCKAENRPIYMDLMRFKRVDGSEGYLGINISPMRDEHGALAGYIMLGGDVTERKTLENQLAQAQKLRSIGELAAGIAHEINTPIQYVGDNTYFLQDSYADLLQVLATYREVVTAATNQGTLTPELITDMEAVAEKVDLEFLCNEIPQAIQQSLDGIGRVSEIVQAMKEFSHPGVLEKVALDINKAVESTITVARNEWKYVADVETDLEPGLPPVTCHPGEISQVLLNIVVNAAQAIGEVLQGTPGEKGNINIQTRQDGEWVEIRVCDTGAGIPEQIRSRIFEPFFTTKEVGRGSGQGLSFAYQVVEIKHGGKLTFETAVGKGSTFIVRLPIKPPPMPAPSEEIE